MRDTIPYALGVAISPVPIAAILVVLTCRRASVNGMGFAMGWTAGVALVAGLLTVLVREAGIADAQPTWIAVLELTLGGVFLVAATALVLRRERREARSLSIVVATETLTPVRAAGLGVILSAANPKVLALALGASVTLAVADTSPAATVASVVEFATIGAAGVLLPLMVYLVFPSRSRSGLASARAAIARRETAVLVFLGLAIGAVFVVDGLRHLA